ncbi:MAG: GGDEF domain-containing protein [Syntrophomonas sp.]
MAKFYRFLDFIMDSSQECPLQYRFLNIMQFAAILGCTICFFANINYNIDVYTALLCAVGTIITSCLYFLSRKIKRHNLSATISTVFFSLILLPGFWFLNGGTRSGILYYYFVVSGAIVIIFRGVKRTVFFVLNLSAYIFLIMIEYKFPEYIIYSKSRSVTYSDLAMDSIIVMIMLTVMYFSIVRHYDAEHKKVNQLLETDELSNCFNRRYFGKRLDQLIETYQTKGNIFSIIIIDVDDFKDVNDRYGHTAGDLLITEIGYFLKSNLNDNFCVARYGGDEFIVLMPDVPLNAAVSVADELCGKCRNKKWVNNKQGITLSIGVIEYEESTKDNIIQEVDNRLYAAKNAGKNQIVYY